MTDLLLELDWDDSIEVRINKGIPYFPLMGRGDFSRPDFGWLKLPIPRVDIPKISSITFAILNK